MGNPYPGEEKHIEIIRKAVEEHPEIREFFCHHFRNSLTAIMVGARLNRLEAVIEESQHMLEDMERVGLTVP